MKNLKTFNIIVILVGVAILSIGVTILLKNSSQEKRGINNDSEKIIIFSSPNIAEEITEIAKSYSLSSKVRIIINYVPESNLSLSISEIDSQSASIGFIGYSPESINSEIATSVGTKKIIGVTNSLDFMKTYINLSSESMVVFKNICQLANIANKINLPIYVSEGSLSIKENFRSIYENDCSILCKGIQRKVISLSDTPVLEFLIENSKDYVLVSDSVIPKLLSDHNFSYVEAMGFYFYYDKDFTILSKGIRANSYDIIQLINDNKLSIVAINSSELENIKESLLQKCNDEMIDSNFSHQSISSKEFIKLNGILLGLSGDIKGLGTTVYQTNKDDAVLFYCQDPENKSCNNFKTFLSSKKAREISKKYE